MKKNDQQYGIPFTQLRDVQATIDAITPLQGGMIAYATDSDKFGFYTPSSFKWLTIPASGTLALLGTANVFTENQTVQKSDGTQADISAITYAVNGGGIFHGKLANGTPASPTKVLAEEIIAGIGGRAYYGTVGFQTSSPASIHYVAEENQEVGAFGAYLTFLTTPVGSASRARRLRIDGSGYFRFGADAVPYFPYEFDASISSLAAGEATLAIVSTTNKSRLEVRETGAAGNAPTYQGKHAAAGPGATLNTSWLVTLSGSGHDGANWITGNKGLIGIAVDGSNWSPTNQPTRIVFETTPAGSTTRAERMRIDNLGNVGIGLIAPLAKTHIDQSSTTGAIPVLTVDQADVSEEFIRFIGTSANGVLTQSVVEAADVGTATIAGYLKIYVQDDGNQLTDQPYFVPIYTLAA